MTNRYFRVSLGMLSVPHLLRVLWKLPRFGVQGNVPIRPYRARAYVLLFAKMFKEQASPILTASICGTPSPFCPAIPRFDQLFGAIRARDATVLWRYRHAKHQKA